MEESLNAERPEELVEVWVLSPPEDLAERLARVRELFLKVETLLAAVDGHLQEALKHAYLSGEGGERGGQEGEKGQEEVSL
ncbi:MAG: hypothetical protein HYY85_01815 [Deltaproteobacteria bacterium]|nr:hypothetical protein [Deltaproteobacteria bacterium]